MARIKYLLIILLISFIVMIPVVIYTQEADLITQGIANYKAENYDEQAQEPDCQARSTGITRKRSGKK